MRSIFWIAAILVGAFIVILLLRTKDRKRSGFRDWLRDPTSFYRQAEKDGLFEDPDPKNVTDEQIREEVFVLLDDDRAQRAAAWLRKVGSKCVPVLVDALRDSRFLNYTRPKDSAFATVPIDHLLSILGRIGDARMAEAMTRFAFDEDIRLRQQAAMALTSLGMVDHTETIRRLLREGNEKLTNHVFFGLQHAIERKTASTEFLSALFDELQQFLIWNEFQFDSKPAQAMLQADPERAISIITSDPVWRSSNPSLVPILRTLLKMRIEIPPPALSQLNRDLGEPDGDRNREEAIGLLLNAQARQRIPGLEPRITKYLNSGSPEIRHHAAEASAALRGVIDPLAHTSNLMEAKGWDALSEPQQFLYAVFALEGEVNNGGFSQYFFNSAGDYWRTALAGTKSIDAVRMADLLEKATNFFGPSGPSPDRDERQEQLAKLIDQREADLHALDDEFYKNEDQRYVRLLLYAAKNAEHFH